ncbi:MAG TPA: CBS domain-containing protein [Steroidobacteraceae bacterium]|nr:CBS domain-containing protein [Steroidobacteraceae bacterium]
MSLTDLCNRSPVTIAAEASLVEAAQLMRARHVGFLVVTPDGLEGPPIGVLTDRDIVVEVVGEAVDPASVTAADAMTREPLVVGIDSSPEQVLAQMRAFGVRRAPVVDATGCLIGVVALDDILDWLADAIGNAAAVVRHEQHLERQLRS